MSTMQKVSMEFTSAVCLDLLSDFSMSFECWQPA